MKVFKIVLPVILLAVFFVSCSNSTGGSGSSSENKGPDYSGYLSSAQGEVLGTALDVKVPENTYRIQVFRKSSKDTDFCFYANVEGDWDFNLSKGSPLECENFTFYDPLVESGTEYSYKVRFVTPDWRNSSFTNPVSITPSSGSGEFKLVNEPKGKVFKENNTYVFSVMPEFSLPVNSLYSTVYKSFLVYAEGKGDEIKPLNTNEIWFDDISIFKKNDSELNIQLGVTAYTYGQQSYGNSKTARITCFASNYFYKLPDGAYTWRRDGKYPKDINFSGNGTSITKNGEKYNITCGGKGQYSGLFVFEGFQNPNGSKMDAGLMFVQENGVPYFIMLSKTTGSEWEFSMYEYEDAFDMEFSYDSVNDVWIYFGRKFTRSELTSIVAKKK